MKTVRFAEHTTEHVPPAVSTSHTTSIPVAYGGSSSSSALSRPHPSVVRVRPDDSDEHTSSKKLKLSDTGDLPSNAPMMSAEFKRHSRCGDLQPTQDSGHVKLHGLDTWVDFRHATKLLGPECSDARRTSVRIPANRTTSALSWIANMPGVHGLAVIDRRDQSSREPVRGVSWSEVATVPKRKSHRGLDLDLSLNSEKNIWKGWKENGGTK